MEMHRVFCEIRPGLLNITEKNFGFESATLLLWFCFFLIWSGQRKFAEACPLHYVSVSPCLLRRIERN